MKLSPYLRTGLAGSAFLLAGSFVLAQTTPAANNMHPRDAAGGQSSGRQAQSGNTPGTTAQSLAVDHAGGNGVRRADTGNSGDNPLYEGKGQANLKSEASAAQSRKHLAGVKYEDHMAGGNPGGTNAQGGRAAQRKNGSIIHSDYPKTADRNSAHATETLRTSDKANTGETPLYEEGGKSGANPMYEPGKMQKAGTTGNPNPSAERQTRKHPGNVKYQNRMIRGGNGAPGMAVNEQGSSKAPARRRR